ncbi:MAG: glutamate synthase-related protein [Methanomassiliicoccales archaeon]|jgi:glutamate synthase domain-containing protein 2|nr:glutamate synthase-related protein [Methanomassiliicoccales archaeon]
MTLAGHYWVTIERDRCRSWQQPWKCGACIDTCEQGVFARDEMGRVYVANEIACVGCKICMEQGCPNSCIYIRPATPESFSRGIWTTQTIEEIHRKAQTGEYEIRGYGTMGNIPHFDGLVVVPSQLASRPPKDKYREKFRMEVTIGEGKCANPIRLNYPFVFAAMSYGAISREGKMALAVAAAKLGILANTGEGGMFPGEATLAHGYENEESRRKGVKKWSPGGYLAVQYSTGRWGVSVDYLQAGDAIEIKIGQGAKPGMGGHLLGKKVTEDIAMIRGLPPGTDALSPCRHYDISDQKDLKKKVEILRDLTNYEKPIMIKMGPSLPYEDTYIAAEAGVDAISIDGMVGGTGASPEVVTQNAGIPTIACIRQASKALKDMGLKGKVKLIALGGIRDGADAFKAIALGADAVGFGAAAEIALGCRGCMSCHRGACHYGLATQEARFRACIDVETASQRLVNFVHACAEELKILAMLSGHDRLDTISADDLRAIDLNTAAMTGIKLAGLEKVFPQSWEGFDD